MFDAPAALRVAAFKQPTHLKLAHDFLWRTTLQLPERGGSKREPNGSKWHPTECRTAPPPPPAP